MHEEEEIKITEELAGEIASKFGYDLDEEEAKQNDLEWNNKPVNNNIQHVWHAKVGRVLALCF